MTMRRALTGVFISSICLAQSSFEVAAVRLSDPDATYVRPPQTTPGTLTLRRMSLRDCIQLAWETPPERVTAPEWLNDVHLDITAKAAGPADEKQLHLMLRTLLAERLGVNTHTEQRETPVYALTVARGGPKFSESATEGPPEFKSDKSGPNMKRVTMSEFGMVLARPLGRPVVDATGLKGRYDIRVDMTSYRAAALADGNQPTAMDIAAITITSVNEQLGLKLEGRKDKVEVLVVDGAARVPKEN